MGNKISTVTAIAGIDSYVSELGDIYYERSIGNARFMKTICGGHKDSLVVVKIFVKSDPQLSLSKNVKKLQDEHDALIEVPNAFSCQRILETEKAAYIVRQYFYSSLYDRISTRPFLTLIEKKWISYQILRGIADAHAKNIYHGDIKTENVMVTSWNWAYLVDFASYKPTYLPEDDPADFLFFFDMSSRRSCYIAPERFYQSGTEIDHRMKNLDIGDQINELTPEMDIFSAGCVIAELFLEGTSVFSLSQLFKYRVDEYSPNQTLDKIEDEHIRDMVKHMIQLDPKTRYTADRYLTEWCDKAFPRYFYTFLHHYISSVTDKGYNVSSSQQQQQQQQNFNSISEPATSTTFISGLNPINRKLTDADEKIERIYHDFDKIAYFVDATLSQEDSNNNSNNNNNNTLGTSSLVDERRRTLSDLPKTIASAIILPPTLNIPNYEPDNVSSNRTGSSRKPGEQGSLIFLSFVCSLIRNTTYPSSKLKALDILLALGEHLPDDVKLDRLVPYLMTLLTDEVALVRANAIKTLTQVLCMVESISPINARIFPEYILPSVREFATDEDVLVRTTYASCIALLAETALRFLEMTQLLKNNNAYLLTDIDTEELDFESTYDSSLQDLKSVIQEQVTTLLIDGESSVKRALLSNITCLCVFFGRQKANDILLSHMITYLNDKDWMLRSTFFESIKGVGTYVGARSLDEYILPLMIQALTDAEEFVIEKVLNSLTSLADLDLFNKIKLWELIGTVAPLMCHPSTWIRYGAIGFISSASKHLSETDLWCIVYPRLIPFLKTEIIEIDENHLVENVKAPLSRQVYERVISWAGKASSRSLYWQMSKTKKSKNLNAIFPSYHSEGHNQTNWPLKGANNDMNQSEQTQRSMEDEGYLERLRNIGMSREDEEKLLFMREYLYKVSRSKLSRPRGFDEFSIFSGEVFLKSIGVTPMTVFLQDIPNGVTSQLTERGEKSGLMQTQSKQDVCKLSRVASEPHVQAILPGLVDEGSKQLDNISLNDGDDRGTIRSAPTPRANRFSEVEPRIEGVVLTTSKSTGTYPENDQELKRSTVGYEHLKSLLTKVAQEAFPPHMPEFTGDPGAMKRIRRLPQGSSSFRSINSWKPEGNLVAHFTEHTASINQLAISWDNLLFASCSDDGSVKIWDCSRLERNVTNRSRVTYNRQGGRIKCLTFIQQTYSIAAASDNGSIHVFRVDMRNAGSALKFGKCVPVRKHQLNQEYAITIKHFTSDASNTFAGSKSILLLATNKGNIYALDLLTMETLWKLKNPISYGVITSIVTDRLHTWMLVGTTRGFLTLYDLRFQILLRSWLHYNGSRINYMLLSHDPKAEGKQVIIAAGTNEVSVWDIVQLCCVEVFSVKLGEDMPKAMKDIHTDYYKALEAQPEDDLLDEPEIINEAHFAENSIQAVVSPSDCRFIITGGSDRKLRFWDIARAESSSVLLGLDSDEPKPRYITTVQDQIKFHFEYPYSQRNSSSTGSMHMGDSSGSNRGNYQSSKETNFAQQQHLLRNHTDAITDVILTEVPYPMIISGDRDGVIKIVS